MTIENEMLKLVEVSKMYYEDNKTQAEIAKVLGVSRPLISKMLNRAKEIGIVKIEIRELFSSNDLLMKQMKEIFNIRGGLIVPEAKTEYITQQTILSHGIKYIKEELPKVSNVGIGWGYTIGNIIEEIQKSEDNCTFKGEVYPLVGMANIPNKGYHPNELISVFSNSTGFSPVFLYAPAFPTSSEERDIYLKTENYQSMEKKWDNIDTIILSVDNYPQVPDQATAIRFGKKLTKEKAIGSFLSYYFNKDGEIIKSDSDYVIQIPLEKLKKAKKVIAICSDSSIDSITGALKTGYITHVITDEKKATQIIINK
ncbi:sugar-binding domain-containing protein [Clostridioides sp. ZZV15-6598]|uniref:sugar-binding transcriptional regulator n=1 Tax=Clostridioides sp. ZZV15-6598 TaxID=2811501 RepID=UPI001D0FB86A|nr:transcriptional regulator [Clostridioides sp. ZZV15-6598]